MNLQQAPADAEALQLAAQPRLCGNMEHMELDTAGRGADPRGRERRAPRPASRPLRDGDSRLPPTRATGAPR